MASMLSGAPKKQLNLELILVDDRRRFRSTEKQLNLELSFSRRKTIKSGIEAAVADFFGALKLLQGTDGLMFSGSPKNN